MPIPIRTQPPSKANKAGDGTPDLPIPQPTNQTRLTRMPATSALQSTTKPIPPGQDNVPRPGLPRPVSANASSVTSHTRSHSTTSARKAPSSSATSVAPLTSQLPSKNVDSSSAPKSHSRTLSASTQPTNTQSRGLHGAIPNPTRPVFKASITSSSSDKATLRKPDFNTYNQHYSPKKTKPVAPPNNDKTPRVTQLTVSHYGTTGTCSVGATPDIVRLQDELLQLSLVQETSATTLHAYEDSVRSQLKAATEDLKNQSSALTALEGYRQGKLNAHAVTSWLQGNENAARTTSDRLLLLAHCVGELYEVTKDDGPLDTLMREFDKWHSYASSRSPNRANHGNRALEDFLTPLDPQWSASAVSLRDRIKACAASLDHLNKPIASSSIGLLIRMHSMLAEGILQEIEVCRDLESLILLQEQAWIEASTTRALSETEKHYGAQVSQVTNRKGIWDTRKAG
ncbi:uncharacterized protein Z518_06252 [Rhinocladiella mackenziei CBS 650.93]|uniref:Rhinocladiella mackenziei CBS 650.93 unplaced genomic scaffold supercont1.4, whole genome shotgun sequence n=1 Tax=Rhinocladiella mackenziei CBS 650.93 TaxID=1442369 RepID=A0A0D2J8F3_9EURO|nr:uncharacterized protein Z518_06252 [Rhinocladiella mackenziei CBS 650.93]KIX05380.1 hypothetical protein Z518_06252 [Rhinocladiella mackenziei CBS 650.93]